MKRTRIQNPSEEYFSRISTSLEQLKFSTEGLLILLGFIGLFLTPRSVAASSGVFQENLPTYTLEIRYQNPAAGQVALVWGVNGWQTLPKEDQPVGTELRNGSMFTPMLLEGDHFVIRLQLPAGTTLDYGFLTTQDPDGNPVNLWEANGDKDFQTVTTDADTFVNIQTALSPDSAPVSDVSAGGNLVNLDIRYTSPTSGEVFLVWGLNGWTLAPEGERPTRTITERNVMHTPMLVEQGIFVTRLQVAPGSVVDFGFLTTKNGQGKAMEVWEANGADDYHIMVNQDSVHKVQSQLALNTGRNFSSILVVGVYVLIGLLVILIVGFVFRRQPGQEGWD